MMMQVPLGVVVAKFPSWQPSGSGCQGAAAEFREVGEQSSKKNMSSQRMTAQENPANEMLSFCK